MSDEIGFSLPPYSLTGGGEPEEDPKITFQGDQAVMRNGRIGTDLECCCEQGCCSTVTWHRVHGLCNNLPDDFLESEVDENCYAYYTWDDWDCVNPLTGRDCGNPDGGCNIYARVKVTGNTPGVIEYLQSGVDEEEVWGPETPGGRCDCPDSFGSLTVECRVSCDLYCSWVWFAPTQTWLTDQECAAPCECPVEQPPGPPVGQEELYLEPCVSPPP